MTAEKVKEALKREEKYLLEIQRAAEQQLTILKAEQVVLERQILHHQSQGSSSSRQQSSDPIIISSVSEVREGEELPELQLDVTSQTICSEPMVIEEEDEDDETEYVEVEEEEGKE